MGWEVNVLKFLEGMRTLNGALLMETLTMTAESQFLVVIIGIIYWCMDKKKGSRLGWNLLISTCTNGWAKMMVRRARPFQVGVTNALRVQTAPGYSFPSGHTQCATAFWGTIMGFFKNPTCFIIGTLAIIGVGFSRLYLGVHWPTDVIGGILLGGLSIWMANQFWKEDEAFGLGQVKGVVIICGVFILCNLIFKGNLLNAHFAKSIGALLGFSIGLYLEERYIHFEPKQSFLKQIIKIGVGLGGIVLLNSLKITGYEELVEWAMFKNALILLWVTGVVPLLGSKI